MDRRSLDIASVVIVGAMAAVGAAVAASLPGALRLPVHWNLGGEADRFAGKWLALMMPAGIGAGVSLFFHLLPKLEPRDNNLARSQGLYLWGWASILLMLVAIEAVTVSVALGWGWRIYHVLTATMGAMFVMIGNQLGKSRSMFLVGIRTPWTLASEEVWIRTHRLGGKLMVAGGLFLIVVAALPIPSGLLATTFAAAVGVMAAVPIVYSYILWRRERRLEA